MPGNVHIGDDGGMRFTFIKLMPLAFAVTLAGCDKVKVSLGKLAELKKTTTEAAGSAGTGEAVADITKATYPAFIAKKDALVIVDFHADWCPPCKSMGPVLETAVAKYPGVAFLGKVDVDRAKDLAAENGIRSIPDVRIFKNGAQVDRIVGFPGEAEILARVDKLAAGMKPAAASSAPADDTATVDAAPPEPKMRRAEKDWLPPGLTRKNAPAPPRTVSLEK